MFEVICVDDSQPKGLFWEIHPLGIVKGETYKVSSVITPEENERLCINGPNWMPAPREQHFILSGVRNPSGAGYRASRFRPVAKPSDTLSIESFLRIKDGFEEPKRVVEPVKKGVGV